MLRVLLVAVSTRDLQPFYVLLQLTEEEHLNRLDYVAEALRCGFLLCAHARSCPLMTSPAQSDAAVAGLGDK